MLAGASRSRQGVVYTSLRVEAVLFPVSNAQPEAREGGLSAGICKKNSEQASLGCQLSGEETGVRDLRVTTVAFL